MWAMATDVEVTKRAATIVLKLGGTARQRAKTIPFQVLQHGGTLDFGDGLGPQQVDGVALLLHVLHTDFGPLGQETSVKAIAEFMAFRKLPSEGVDQAFARFEILLHKAETEGQHI